MKFREILRFELDYQIRRPWTWLMILVVMALVFLFVRGGSISEALYSEFFINSPFMVAMSTVFGNLLWLVMGAFIAGEAASRDVASGMYPLTYTTPLSRAQYLGGKFIATFLLSAVVLLTVQLSIILAVYLPGVDPDALGPFRPEAFLTAYIFIALPNAFAATTIQFTFALKSGKPITAYVASLLLFFTAFFIAALILFRSGLGVLLDPLGVRFIWDELSHLWTTVEKSHRLLELEGPLLYNRLLWTGTGILFLAYSYLSFGFRHRVPFELRLKFWRGKSSLKDEPPSFSRTKPIDMDHVRPVFGLLFQLYQITTIAWASFRAIATSWTGIGMLIFIPLLAIPVVIDQMIALGLPMVPTTSRVLAELTAPLSAIMGRWIVIPGLIIYFTGELVWRERDYRLGEIVDAMPGSEWPRLLGKLLGMILVLVAFLLALSIAGVIAQMLLDYDVRNYGDDVALYLKVMFGLQLWEYALFAALALFVHAVANQKYLGHLIAIFIYAFILAVAGLLGIEHNMLIFGAGPGWSYTEMRGFGTLLSPWLWFKLYWTAWAIILIVAARLLWPRGKEHRFFLRLQQARNRLTSATVWVASVAGVLLLFVGGYVFYNTNILHTYRDSSDIEEWKAEYERRYGQFETMIQPELAGAKVHAEIFPEEGVVEIRGTYQLFNSSSKSIDAIHVSMPMGGVTTTVINFDEGTTLALDDDEHLYRIYSLQRPLLPGDSLNLKFEIRMAPKGFTNNGVDPSIMPDGTYFSNVDWFPSIGYQRQRGLVNPAQRQEYGLEPRPVLSALSEAHDGEARSIGSGINFEAILGTSPDQVAVAPGSFKGSWINHGRQYFHYKSSGPIGGEWNFFSADFDIYTKEWIPPKAAIGKSLVNAKPVEVRIYHHPKHTAHLEHMMRGALASLEYYVNQFGNYPYDHLTLVEHPAAPGTGMHADPSLIYYGQGYAHWLPRSEHDLDLPYAIMGHEMGHQWTLPYAYVEGLPFLSEGLAWYYGIMMVKATRGPGQIRKLMSFMREPYPHKPIRRGEPLLRALDPYLAYKRGPLAMYALAEYAGSSRVNTALRTLNNKSDSPGASPVSTLDLYRELKAVTPDSLQNMLHDLFEVNALWMFETSKVKAVDLGDDRWRVTLTLKVRKILYDSAGVETDVPVREWIPIGVFGKPAVPYDELSTPVYLEMHQITSGEQTISIIVTGKPVLAGIDPHHLLDWEEKEDDDNIEEVVIEKLTTE